MSGFLTCGGGDDFPAFLAHVQPAVPRIWKEGQGRHIALPIASHQYRTAKSILYQICDKTREIVHGPLPSKDKSHDIL